MMAWLSCVQSKRGSFKLRHQSEFLVGWFFTTEKHKCFFGNEVFDSTLFRRSSRMVPPSFADGRIIHPSRAGGMCYPVAVPHYSYKSTSQALLVAVYSGWRLKQRLKCPGVDGAKILTTKWLWRCMPPGNRRWLELVDVH